MKYDNKYYNEIINNNKYTYTKDNNLDVEFIRRWICSYNLAPFLKGFKNKEKCLITMGIGINGTPHLGTLSQLINAIYLQKIGYKVQIILGDLDVYGARAFELKEINKLVKKYKQFIISLGFDAKQGILRTQYESDDVLKTQYLISNRIKDEDFYEIEEDINEIYKEENVYQGMEFSVKQSIALMFADFLHPIIKGGYKHVLITSGIDEHGYVWKANEILSRLGYKGTVSGMFTDILPGLNKYPKMSKSLKISTIDLDMNKSDIKKIMMDDELDSLIIRLIDKVSFYDVKKINKIKEDYKNGGKDWINDKLEYIEILYDICKKWRK